MFQRTLARTTLALGLTVSALSLTGCGGSQKPEVKTADHIKAGEMPADGEWEGVYYNQVFGFLHITESSGAAQGAWRTTAGDKWGELYGEIDGNLLKYTWTEYKVGVVGPNAKSEGKGYFIYTVPKPDEAHELKGEWGLGENAVGHSWDCVKQMNEEPDPKSVRPNEMEAAVGASGFDGAKGDEDLAPAEDEEMPAEGEDAGETEEEAPEGI